MKSVLIADDERAAREGIAQAVDWERLGIGRVILAADGAEAFQSIESERPDIAIVDIVMPEMTGIELISAFRDDAEAPEFLIVSGHDEFGYAQQAIRCNVHDYLLKPCDPLEMEESIRRALEKIERRQARSSIDPETAQAAPIPRSVSDHRDAKGRGGFAGSSPPRFRTRCKGPSPTCTNTCRTATFRSVTSPPTSSTCTPTTWEGSSRRRSA